MIAYINTKKEVIDIINCKGNIPIKYLVYEIFRQPQLHFHNNKSTKWLCKTAIADHDHFISDITHDFDNLENNDWRILIEKLQSFTVCNFNTFLDKKSIRQQLFIEINYKKYKSIKSDYFHKIYSKKISWVDHLAIHVHTYHSGISQRDIDIIHQLSEEFKKIKSADKIFNWFNIADKQDKIITTSNWLKRHKLDLTKDIDNINNIEVIKSIFDRIENNIEKKQLILEKIKKSHNNQKSAKKQIANNRKRNQTNLNIKEHYHDLIKKFAETTGESPARVVEHALDLYLLNFQANILNNSVTLMPPTATATTQTAFYSQNLMQNLQQPNSAMPLSPPIISQTPPYLENEKQTESYADIARRNTIRHRE